MSCNINNYHKLVRRPDIYLLSSDDNSFFYIGTRRELDGIMSTLTSNLQSELLQYCRDRIRLYHKCGPDEIQMVIVAFISTIEMLSLFLSDLIGTGWSDTMVDVIGLVIALLLCYVQSSIIDFFRSLRIRRQIELSENDAFEKILDEIYLKSLYFIIVGNFEEEKISE